MKNNILSRIYRYIIPFSAAVMLTFQRNGFLDFNEIYMPFDLLINYFVCGVALILFIRQFYDGKSLLISRRDILFIVLFVWISFIILLFNSLTETHRLFPFS